jgi:ubiquinone/menaquinone biosynthesis C-methylase UbiE
MEQTKALSQGQIAAGAADVYERFFVPALFAQWPPHLAQAAAVERGDWVLDVACGTGIAARYLACDVVGPSGSVVGLDRNAGMLSVAERMAPQLEWRQGQAEALPFEDNSIDAVVWQFGLMFFDNRLKSLQEMARVLRPGGRVAVAVWDSYANSPGYASLIELLARLFGESVADELRQPFVLGDMQKLQQLFAEAGIPDATIGTQMGVAHFPSLESWIHTEIRGWTLAETLDDEAQRRLLVAATEVMQPYVSASGAVAFPAPAHIVSAAVP